MFRLALLASLALSAVTASADVLMLFGTHARSISNVLERTGASTECQGNRCSLVAEELACVQRGHGKVRLYCEYYTRGRKGRWELIRLGQRPSTELFQALRQGGLRPDCRFGQCEIVTHSVRCSGGIQCTIRH